MNDHKGALLSELALAKAECRRCVLLERDAMSAAARHAGSDEIAQRLLAHPAYARATTLLMTMSIGSEIDTRGIFVRAKQDGKRVVLPRVVRREPMLQLRHAADLSTLVSGVMGIMEPPIDAPEIALDDIDFVLAPGVAFDQYANRLGYGGGYFDRLLSFAVPGTTIGALAFDCQLVDTVPCGPTDLPMQFVISPSQTFVRSSCP